MRRIQSLNSGQLKFEFVLPSGKIVEEEATEVVILWNETGLEDELVVRYPRMQAKLEARYGEPINKETAYFLVENATQILYHLKKTHTSLVDSKSSVSIPEAEAMPSYPSSTVSSHD